MPLVKPPTAISLPGQSKDDRHYAVSFQYAWTGDAPLSQNLGGIPFTGSIFTLDLLSVKTPANFPPMRSLSFTETYLFETDEDDGELIVYVPASGQVQRIATPGYNGSGGNNVITQVSGIIPLVTNSPTQVQFGKAANANDGLLHGTLTATLFDFKLYPYLNTGVASEI